MYHDHKKMPDWLEEQMKKERAEEVGKLEPHVKGQTRMMQARMRNVSIDPEILPTSMVEEMAREKAGMKKFGAHVKQHAKKKK